MEKILHVVPDLSRSSGIMAVLINYMKETSKQGFITDFLRYRSDDGYADVIKKAGGSIFTFPEPSIKNSGVFIKTLEDFFKNAVDYSVCVVSDPLVYRFIAPLCKRAGIRIAAYAHNTRFGDGFYKNIRNSIIASGFGKNADLLFACSDIAGISLFGNDADFYVLKNAVNPDDFKFSAAKRAKRREALGLSDAFVIGNVGRFAPQKNHKFLYKVFYEYAEKDERARLLLIGKGKPDVPDYIRDKTVVVAEVKDMQSYYSAMDFFAFPSVFEGFGNVTVEAQLNGMFVAASTAIPPAAAITDSFIRLPLDTQLWVDKLSEIRGAQIDRNREISPCGFDIKSAAEYFISIITE